MYVLLDAGELVVTLVAMMCDGEQAKIKQEFSKTNKQKRKKKKGELIDLQVESRALAGPCGLGRWR